MPLIKSSILGMLLTFLSTAGAVPASCLKPKPNECGFYRECLEEKYHCGDSGYPLAYGEKYCHRFNSLNESNLSPEGLKWRDATLVCLQEDLVGRLLSPSYVANCDQLKQVAYNSHPRCYTQPGNSICSLKYNDVFQIVSTVDAKDGFTLPSGIQIGKVIITCKNEYLNKLRELLGKREQLSSLMMYQSMHTSSNAKPLNTNLEQEQLSQKIDNELEDVQLKLQLIDGIGYEL